MQQRPVVGHTLVPGHPGNSTAAAHHLLVSLLWELQAGWGCRAADCCKTLGPGLTSGPSPLTACCRQPVECLVLHAWRAQGCHIRYAAEAAVLNSDGMASSYAPVDDWAALVCAAVEHTDTALVHEAILCLLVGCLLLSLNFAFASGTHPAGGRGSSWGSRAAHEEQGARAQGREASSRTRPMRRCPSNNNSSQFRPAANPDHTACVRLAGLLRYIQ
jgi:hypothetical protein